MIRDQYLASVDSLYREQVRKNEKKEEKAVEYDHTSLKYVYSKHAPGGFWEDEYQ